MEQKLRKIMIVAGEPSGDRHAAKLVTAFRETAAYDVFEFFGAAGPLMRDAGVKAIIQSDKLSIVGMAEIGRQLPMFLRAFRTLKAAATKELPDVAVFVDFPDFNLKLARSLKRLGIPVVYYISPQLWAWRKYRIRTIRRYVDLVLAILPFEKEWYSQNGVEHVEYVGNPLAREVHTTQTKDEFCEFHGLRADDPIVALLPGSREKEIMRIFPVMMEAASELIAVKPGTQFIVAAASNRSRELIKKQLGTSQVVDVAVVENETYNAVNAADAAVVTSGTATLETGIIGTPLVVVYKTSVINYALLGPLISVEHYGLINLIAGKRIAVELIQKRFNAKTTAAELERLLDPQVNKQVRAELRSAALKLGQGGASKRAADAILRLLSS